MAATVAPVVSVEGKTVFAHFIVGNAAGMTTVDWKSDIELAKAASIDGFVLNIGPQDSYTYEVLQRAYTVAAEVGDFALFLSFDYLTGGPWSIDRVIQLINSFQYLPAQFKYNDKPVVTTFEGVNNIYDWISIKEATGCYFIPTWTSLGPSGLNRVLDIIDGGSSWDAWPNGANPKSRKADDAYRKVLGPKTYMMPVSAWFYTSLPQWGKNWLWRGDDLWFMRWQQVITLQPEIVQILTWNDYGESSYIGPIHKNGIPDGAAEYVDGKPHDGWRALLPHFIAAYKMNGRTISQYNKQEKANSCKLVARSKILCPVKSQQPADIITFWYRVNPGMAGSAGGTTGNDANHGQQTLSPTEVSEDKVFVTVFAQRPSTIFVQIGEWPEIMVQLSSGLQHFNVPYGSFRGQVKITLWRDGKMLVKTTGPEITDSCVNGKVNWNAFVGSSLDG
ncbi:alpha-1,3-glucanase [Paracoccidioides lutzii Pb01]|uniref:Alpha-1,3-glucanase n=1 Tax=Paracoccidioides lutzii (strain ATCC MYA-826 / Pb01) TaxID=502779 RepID=C1H0B2_PARBA|nr:alpha-1,3-glucanase [Paracoccidioides lutzii Pb01]EEH33153.2 alpha-1,3-glucanase [Paracoccidioides lutzii Pb01]